METVELKKENLRAAYNNGTEVEKKLLENLYGKQHFGNIMDRVKSVEDACRELGIDYDDLHEECPDEYKEAEKDIETMAEALSEGAPMSERVYYPYFNRSGGGFSLDVYVYAPDYSNVGARLRVDSPDKARHMGKCLLSQYKIYHNG